MSHDVFISYGREDTPLMQQIEKALHEAGFTIWTDRGIAPGSPSWKAEIEKAILDARCIVVLFSPDSAESRWVRAELDYADAQRKPIYPLLVRGDSTKAIPFGFTSYQWIDVRGADQLNAGLERLIAVLRGDQASLSDAAAPTPTTAPPRSRMMITIAVGLILAGLVLGLVLMSINAQTPVATPTVPENAAFAQPTALPTMPPFSIPDGFKKLEGKKTLVAVPSNWSTNFDPAIMSESLRSLMDDNQTQNMADTIQMVLQNMDSVAADMIHFQSITISVEDVGISLSYPVIETRQKSIYLDAVPNGTFASRGVVDLPAGAMLVTEASNNASLYLLVYSLARGSSIYALYFTSRLADKEMLDSNAEKIVQTFRVKE